MTLPSEVPTVRWVECPRDAWQGLAEPVPPAAKRAHLQALLAAGFGMIDAGSFVSPRAVPQMADSDEVLSALRPPAGAEILAIVLNRRGLERALATETVGAVGLPLGVSDTFERRNAGRGRDEGRAAVVDLARAAQEAGLASTAYLSMAFGNPYGDAWSPELVAGEAARLREAGVERLSLADTVGRADVTTVAEVLDAVEEALPRDRAALGLHLHARPDGWQPLLEVAWRRGVRWFEGALAGVGGCPFAGDALVGNLPSERVLRWLREQGAESGIDLAALPRLAREAAALAAG